jgi:hypothetical protein
MKLPVSTSGKPSTVLRADKTVPLTTFFFARIALRSKTNLEVCNSCLKKHTSSSFHAYYHCYYWPKSTKSKMMEAVVCRNLTACALHLLLQLWDSFGKQPRANKHHSTSLFCLFTCEPPANICFFVWGCPAFAISPRGNDNMSAGNILTSCFLNAHSQKWQYQNGAWHASQTLFRCMNEQKRNARATGRNSE